MTRWVFRGAVFGLAIGFVAWLVLAFWGPGDSRWQLLDWLVGRPMGYGPYETDSPNPGPVPGSLLDGEYVIVLEKSGPNPREITLPRGGTVRFINRCAAAHRLKVFSPGDGTRQDVLSECPALGPQEHWSCTFIEPGTYEVVHTPGPLSASVGVVRIIVAD